MNMLLLYSISPFIASISRALCHGHEAKAKWYIIYILFSKDHNISAGNNKTNNNSNI